MTIRWNAVSLAGVLCMLAGGAVWAVGQAAAPAAPAPAARTEDAGHACCAPKGQAARAHADCSHHGKDREVTIDSAVRKCPHAAARTAGDREGHAAPAGGQPWVCPMHPDVTSGARGRCPQCGMFLEKKS